MADAKNLGSILNPIDRLVGWISPAAGLRRIAAREGYERLQRVESRAHESSEPNRLRRFFRDRLGPNGIVSQGAAALRAQARHMDRNNDIARGILRTMVNNVVGSGGIGVEPQPRKKDGTIHEDFAKELRRLHVDWCRRPEVQERFHFAKCQRMMAKAWIRDGEGFSQDLIGIVPGLNHRSIVPYSLELFEADFVPLEYNDGNTIVQGVERNAWGAARAFWVYKVNPLEGLAPIGLSRNDLKRVEAARIKHVAFLDHIGQSRGISEFASIIARLEDIRDYEESERIAAKVAASLTAYVKKTAGQEGYDSSSAPKDQEGNPIGRDLRMTPGMIVDGLLPGEEIGLIDSKRPNPNVVTFRQGQLRAAAAGIGASYSSISKSYDGTFSAQRQELVEQWVNYAVLADEFTGQWVQPVYETFVQVAILSGAIKVPRDLLPGSEDDALFVAQAMPWIDPLKEAQGWIALARAGFASEIEVLRRRGVSPRDFLEQVTQWRKEARDKGLVFTSDASNDVPILPPSTGAAGAGNDTLQGGNDTAAGSSAD